MKALRELISALVGSRRERSRARDRNWSDNAERKMLVDDRSRWFVVR